MGRIIGFVSGKGGVGKSCITAGIGKALANLNKSVCLVDFDFGLNNLDLMLGIETNVVYDLTDYFAGRSRLRQTLVPDNEFDGLYYLSTHKASSFDAIDKSLLKEVITKLGEVFEYVLIDCSAGMGQDFKFIIDCVNEIIIVSTPNICAIRDASKVASEVFKLKKQAGVIVNKLRGDLVLGGKSFDEKQIAKTLGLKLIGVMPEYEAISVYSSIKSVYNTSLEVKNAFIVLAKNILKNTSFCVDYTYKFKGVIGALRRKLKARA
ncbi:MAG: P-loop NTPase [Clostridia bacterium]|nr:P-loop NTPase [Clostridia bacterium]